MTADQPAPAPAATPAAAASEPSRRLLRDVAYEALLAAIVSGELAPGAKLGDVELAARLGLTRAPVRDALARLATERLVVSKPQSYTRVAPLVAEEIRGALAVVGAMHTLAVREALPRLERDHLARMRSANAEFVRAVGAGDIAAAISADDAFHAVPVAASGNQPLADTVARYTPLLRRLEHQRFSSTAARASAARHEDLIAACEARDADRAAEISYEIWAELE
ncbi:GntR family transcriptional regulator [Streptomyces sp. WM6378]|uniref:GntR family transcriptional regulator n=1 Tax=Streptomyces sp. WM6378 TaxID=1415557 RepID=UPI001F26C39E|nr:GntR family transcriptional regulator [Streptomyces sp. WM6378]